MKFDLCGIAIFIGHLIYAIQYDNFRRTPYWGIGALIFVWIGLLLREKK